MKNCALYIVGEDNIKTLGNEPKKTRSYADGVRTREVTIQDENIIRIRKVTTQGGNIVRNKKLTIQDKSKSLMRETEMLR